MGRIWGLARFPLALLAAIAILILFGADSAPVEATTFNPTQAVAITPGTTSHSTLAPHPADHGPGSSVSGHPSVETFSTIPQTGTDAFFNQSFSFFPDTLGLALDADIRDGTVAGDADFIVSLGFANSQCVNLFGTSPDAVTFFHATTSRATLEPFATTTGDSNTELDDTAGVPNGVDHYPLFLAQTVPSGELIRFWGHTTVPPIIGIPVDIHYLVYPAGSFGLPLGLGKPTLVTFNTGDVGAPTPSITTDSCPFFSTSVKSLGLAQDNVNTIPNESAAASQPGGSDALITTPAPGTVLFSLLSLSERDADNDNIDNSDDTCMYDPNVGTPYTGADAGDAGEPPGGKDGIDAACDNTSVTTDGNTNPWDATSTCRMGAADNGITAPPPAAGFDCDDVLPSPPFAGDGFPNRGDNCPQVANASQVDSEELLPGALYLDGGPKADRTGDACDVNVDVPDGHFHQPLRFTPKCITGGGVSDTDSDGYCDPTEAALGSNPGVTASTPEHLAIPTVCSDTADNDGDGGTDLGKDADGDTFTDPTDPADSGCQRPLHDVRMDVDEASTVIYNPNDSCKSNNISDPGLGLYKVKIEEKDGPHPMEIGIYIDPVSSGGSFGSGTFTAPGTVTPGPVIPGVGILPQTASPEGIKDKSKVTVTANGPVNFDSDTDVEWLAKATMVGDGVDEIRVQFPDLGTCPGGSDSTPIDYIVTIDVCHSADPIPLGVAVGNNPKDCGATADGGQDRLRNPGELLCPGQSNQAYTCGPADDAAQTISVNDLSR